MNGSNQKALFRSHKCTVNPNTGEAFCNFDTEWDHFTSPNQYSCPILSVFTMTSRKRVISYPYKSDAHIVSITDNHRIVLHFARTSILTTFNIISFYFPGIFWKLGWQHSGRAYFSSTVYCKYSQISPHRVQWQLLHEIGNK